MRRALRPLVSLLIKNSVSYQMICQLLKEQYVDVAASQYGKGGRPTNITRISLLTGIDRKDVKRIRDTAIKDTEVLAGNPKSRSGALGRLLSGWYQDPDFSSNGKPKPLAMDTEFADLCKRYGGDITRTAILNELLRVNAVEKTAKDQLLAKSRFYMPDTANTEAIMRSFDVYHDLGNTLLYNLYRDSTLPSRFEGRATNARVPLSCVGDFREFVEENGQRLLEHIDERLSGYEKDAPANEESVRLGLGVFWIEEQQDSES